MLTSIATIAAAVSSLIVLGYGIAAGIKSYKKKKWIDGGRSLEAQILDAKTDEERAKLARLYSDHLSGK